MHGKESQSGQESHRHMRMGGKVWPYHTIRPTSYVIETSCLVDMVFVTEQVRTTLQEARGHKGGSSLDL